MGTHRLWNDRIRIATAAFTVMAGSWLLAGSNELVQSAHAQASGGQAEVVNLDFKGGTVVEYVAALQAALPGANVMVLGEFGNAQVPATKLKSVQLWQALSVLQSLGHAQYDPAVSIMVDREMPEGGPGTQAIYTVVGQVNAQRRDHATVMVAELDDLTKDGGVKANDILTAAESALTLIATRTPPPPPADLRYHEDTALLITRGTPEQLDAVRQVLMSLRESAHKRMASNQATEQLTTAMERLHQEALTRQEVEKREQSARVQLVEAMTKLELVSKMLDERSRQYENRVNDAMAQIASLEQKNRALQQELADAYRRLEEAQKKPN